LVSGDVLIGYEIAGFNIQLCPKLLL